MRLDIRTLRKLPPDDIEANLGSARRDASDALENSVDGKGRAAANRRLRRIDALWNELLGECPTTESDKKWLQNVHEVKTVGLNNITPGHHLYKWLLMQRQLYRKHFTAATTGKR